MAEASETKKKPAAKRAAAPKVDLAKALASWEPTSPDCKALKRLLLGKG